MSRFQSTLVILLGFIISFSGRSSAIPATQWMQSGTNFVWVPYGGPDGGLNLALTIGGGTDYAPDFTEWDLRGLADGYDWFNPAPIADNVPIPLDGGQYFCYVVDGNLAVTSQFFEPSNYSFACSQVPPHLDLSPTLALQPTYGSTYSVATWDAGFVGSVFRQDGGNGWQPWFRNGEQVMFDVPEQLSASPVPDSGLYTPPIVSKTMPSIDPGMVLGRLVFSRVSLAQQTISLPPIVDVGEVIQLQFTNEAGNAVATYPPALIRIIAKYPDPSYPADVIGEATVGGINHNNGAGLLQIGPANIWARIATYSIDSSEYFGNRTPNGITFDVSDMGTLSATQFVTVSAVLHGYHEPIK